MHHRMLMIVNLLLYAITTKPPRQEMASLYADVPLRNHSAQSHSAASVRRLSICHGGGMSASQVIGCLHMYAVKLEDNREDY